MVENLGLLFLYCSGLFLVSVAISSLAMQWIVARRERSGAQVRPTGPLKIRGGSGMYRAHFVSGTSKNWVISAPLQRDSYVPLQPGEELKIEAPMGNGAVLFRSTVISRDADSREITISRPAKFFVKDRRSESRFQDSMNVETCVINGEIGKVVNISSAGALILSTCKPQNGDLIRLELGGSEVLGVALDSVYESMGERVGGLTRIKFQEPYLV
ncbi:MAG: flagellar brake protein, partial [Armatimonadetes bacterium]|nr:flagellar brake protein [Armatimonadota bacterium]